jgi:hypothetical protein
VTVLDLLWAPPLLLAIAVALAAAGRTEQRPVGRAIVRRFFELTIGLGFVGITIRLIVVLLA